MPPHHNVANSKMCGGGVGYLRMPEDRGIGHEVEEAAVSRGRPRRMKGLTDDRGKDAGANGKVGTE